MKRLLAFTIGIICFASISMSQNFTLSKFTNASGLPQNYVYSIVQDNNGFIWIGMAEGLSRYDGIRFTNYSVRDSLASNYVSKMLIDTDGTLWCGHGNGAFSYSNGQKFVKLRSAEEMTSPIKDMHLDDKGNIWAVEQNQGIVKISPDKELTTYFDEDKFGSHLYTSICAVNSMMLLVGTSDGLLTVKVNVDGTLHKPEETDEFEGVGINCIKPMLHGKSFWVCCDDGSVYKYSPINGAEKLSRCSKVCELEEESEYDIRSIYEDTNGDLYIGTYGEGLKKWKYRSATNDYVEVLTIDETNGLGNNYVTDIVLDREGIYWFATYGGGVVAWTNSFFANYSLQDIGLIRSKAMSAQVKGNRLWIGMNSALVSVDVDCMGNFDYYDQNHGVPRGTDITSIVFNDHTSTQYIGTSTLGVFYREYDEHKFKKLPLGPRQENEESINDMTCDEEHLYIATKGGLVVHNTTTKATRVYTTLDQLPHNNINFVYLDPDGQLWLGPKDNMIANMVNDSTFERHRLAADLLIDVSDMTVDERGRIWLATSSNGVLCYQDSIVPITTTDGLEKNYCYGLAKDRNDHIWVCHKPGLSCIDLGSGNIHTYNQSNGFDYEFGMVSAGENGDLWFPTSMGVVRYIGEFDKTNNAAPIMNMTNVVIAGKRHSANEDIDLDYPYNGDVAKLEFSFVGIYMRDPRNVSYEYWLQRVGDHEAKWMPLGTQNHKEFDYLPSGDYILNIRAFNSMGLVSQRMLQTNIHIDKPFWSMAWFPFVAIVALIALVSLFAKRREHQLRLRQQELETEVARQTREINEKKNEIEEKNKDITGSITYANRIQTAMLPSRNSLKDFPFADSFIFFRPRDIVSGDFYWFNRYGDHVLICCGDCTGHGVPGAFMTLIGTTIINDATRDADMRQPSHLLARLDKDVKMTLNKNQTIETRDGMDISIIDIDLVSGIMVSAAAKRPIYIVRKGQLTTIKGTRRAIGDVWNDNEFLETTTQLQNDDCIYMCSDGYADQLGDDHPNKGNYKVPDESAMKFSSQRFMRLLERIADEPMEDQQKKLRESFDGWRKNLPALDDVIVMGIRFKFLDKK